MELRPRFCVTEGKCSRMQFNTEELRAFINETDKDIVCFTDTDGNRVPLMIESVGEHLSKNQESSV
jgi:phosphomannomutase